MQAHFDGLIDLGDELSPRWYRKLSFVIEYAAQRNRVKVDEANLLLAAAMLTATPDAEHAENARLAVNRLITDVMPWLNTGPTDLRQIIHKMRDQYVKRWGDPEDPKYQKKVQELIDYWRSIRERK